MACIPSNLSVVDLSTPALRLPWPPTRPRLCLLQDGETPLLLACSAEGGADCDLYGSGHVAAARTVGSRLGVMGVHVRQRTRGSGTPGGQLVSGVWGFTVGHAASAKPSQRRSQRQHDLGPL